jgi:hypothetical protein
MILSLKQLSRNGLLMDLVRLLMIGGRTQNKRLGFVHVDLVSDGFIVSSAEEALPCEKGVIKDTEIR